MLLPYICLKRVDSYTIKGWVNIYKKVNIQNMSESLQMLIKHLILRLSVVIPDLNITENERITVNLAV